MPAATYYHISFIQNKLRHNLKIDVIAHYYTNKIQITKKYCCQFIYIYLSMIIISARVYREIFSMTHLALTNKKKNYTFTHIWLTTNIISNQYEETRTEHFLENQLRVINWLFINHIYTHGRKRSKCVIIFLSFDTHMTWHLLLTPFDRVFVNRQKNQNTHKFRLSYACVCRLQYFLWVPIIISLQYTIL